MIKRIDLPGGKGKLSAAGSAGTDPQLLKAEAELVQLNRELAKELALAAVDVAGVIDPTPISDAIGLGLSLAQGDLIGAGLSLISMVPYAGDALGKTAKGARSAKRINELRKRILAATHNVERLRKARKVDRPSKAREALKQGKRAPRAKPTTCVACRRRILRKLAKQESRIKKQLRSPEHLKKRAEAYQRYCKRGGALSREKWEAKYDTLARNRQAGKYAEEQFQRKFGGYSGLRLDVEVDGKMATRIVDNVYGNVAREVKAGYVRLDDFISAQIKKDQQLIRMKKMKIEWHLMKGADLKVITALEEAGIGIIRY